MIKCVSILIFALQCIRSPLNPDRPVTQRLLGAISQQQKQNVTHCCIYDRVVNYISYLTGSFGKVVSVQQVSRYQEKSNFYFPFPFSCVFVCAKRDLSQRPLLLFFPFCTHKSVCVCTYVCVGREKISRARCKLFCLDRAFFKIFCYYPNLKVPISANSLP